MLGGRPVGFVLRQLAQVENYRALWRIRRVAVQPGDFLRRYLFGKGTYPARCPVRTPAGVIAPTVFSHHDVITVNEVFCRLDYRLRPDARLVVDIGSNIGISALYFLTVAPAVRCHLYEPDPRNVERLRGNLADFAERIELREVAVADRGGTVAFGREPSGRYGGIGLVHPDQIEVECLHIDAVLGGILEREGWIDLLKIDIEGLENRTVQAIRRDLLERIGAICFETREPVNPAPDLFELRYATETARLERRGGAPATAQPAASR
jgi:FkbM family methyltransferase